MANVRLENVRKIYSGNIIAVKGVSFEVPERAFTVLVGPSGCGKSTILRMIAGLEEVTEGDIYIDGKRVNDIPPKDRDIAMVFQNYALYPHMTVYKNMAFGLKLRKYPKAEIDQRVKEAAGMLGISHLLERKPKNLSGGERQRVAVGRAIVRHPKVFLFDEPLSNLDAKLRVQMRMEISKLHDRLGATMLYVTHDQVEAMTMGDEVVVLNQGEIQQIADPPTLYHQPSNEFVGGFIGTPPMNFIDVQIISDHGVPRLVFETFELNVNGRMKKALSQFSGSKVRLGIRPEDILVHHGVEPKNVANCVSTTVELVEPLGSNVLLYLRTQSNSFIARADGTVFPEHNSPLNVTFNMEKAHLFHPETGVSMTLI
ncbi:sn-glycerol-3-phosphate ABC transporter ATP-binding protein UgpC [Candidatus Poribacteria bacterium]|nr:sn-glycerol-3-phosphate ABC transporter ATP-binding protein UgpC [Candidatus Poribacteria bacterium]